MKTLKRLYTNILMRITFMITALVTKVIVHLLKVKNLDPNMDPNKILKDKISRELCAVAPPAKSRYTTYIPISTNRRKCSKPKYVFSEQNYLKATQVIQELVAKNDTAKNAAIPFLDPKDVIEIKEDVGKLDALLESIDVDVSDLCVAEVSSQPTKSNLDLWKETFEAAQADPDFKIIAQPTVKSKRRAKKPEKKVPAKPPVLTTKPVKKKTKKETKKGKKK